MFHAVRWEELGFETWVGLLVIFGVGVLVAIFAYRGQFSVLSKLVDYAWRSLGNC